MSYKELGAMQAKLHNAQAALSDVYHYACENGIDFVERNMSCADGCIQESIEWLEKLEAQAIDNASWRA